MNTPSTPPPQTSTFAHQAAKASWFSAVIIFLLLSFGSRIGGRLFVELGALLLMVVGLALGVIALFGTRKHGIRGILAPALAGIIINGLLMFIFATNFFAARAKAKARVQNSAAATITMSSVVSTSFEMRVQNIQS